MSKLICPKCKEKTFIDLDATSHWDDEQVEAYECLNCNFLFEVRAYLDLKWEVVDSD